MAVVRRLVASSLSLVFALPLAAQQYPADMLSGCTGATSAPCEAGRTYGVAG